MRQKWTPLNVDKRERYDPNHHEGRLGEYLFSSEPHKMFYHLLRVSVRFPAAKKPRFDKTESFCFPTFPAEIVSHIFDLIDDENVGDCFALALTSERCWIIGQPRMTDIILRFRIAWAGDRIICIGNHSAHGDLPKGLLSAEEETEYQKCAPGSLESYCTPLPAKSYGHSPNGLVANVLYHVCQPLSLSDRRRICSAIEIVVEDPQILRNISKRQYVRRSKLVEMRLWSSKYRDFNFGHVVASRICWSSDPTHSLSYEGDIHRGVWAGDRFDITSLAALKEKDENGQRIPWTDVTTEVLGEMQKIWSSDYDGT